MSHRNLVIAAGIGVAIIILLTLWTSLKNTTIATSSPATIITIPDASKLSVIKDVLRKVSKVEL